MYAHHLQMLQKYMITNNYLSLAICTIYTQNDKTTLLM